MSSIIGRGGPPARPVTPSALSSLTKVFSRNGGIAHNTHKFQARTHTSMHASSYTHTHIHMHTHLHEPKPTKYLRDWRQGWCLASVPVKRSLLSCCLFTSAAAAAATTRCCDKGEAVFYYCGECVVVVTCGAFLRGKGPDHALFSNTPLLSCCSLAIVSGGVRRDVLRVITNCCFAQSKRGILFSLSRARGRR